MTKKNSKANDASACFRFYEELNDFLPVDRRKQSFVYRFKGNPSVKDAIEAIGVPHTEVDLIVANGEAVSFEYHLKEGDRIAVYPVFESLDISPIVRLREKPLRQTAFILDVHLGKLARLLRMLGFDALYRNDFQDEEIIKIALEEKRIILTRDRGLLKNGAVTHGYCIRSSDALIQAKEVLQRFNLFSQVNPFHKCIACNGEIISIEKQAVLSKIPAGARKYYHKFYQCLKCKKIYWQGSHYQRLQEKVRFILGAEPQ